ncbi:unnamed protein product [Litomosoides sigmodontis]|uniref:Uncharacterized protein n=1 Tax=Litomosoides sigmodontis TaxID=42156 RepID=A0A3P6SIU3_LITSI|nr:unnamed protein product [Litomosoides sigmodontis]
MDANSKFHPEYRSSTASTSMNETELDFEPVVSGLSDAAAITTGQLITQTVGGENVYDVITASSSDSSDGSSNEFVKVEHSDAQQSGGSIGDSVSFKISQVHSDGDDKMNGTDGIFPITRQLHRVLGLAFMSNACDWGGLL